MSQEAEALFADNRGLTGFVINRLVVPAWCSYADLHRVAELALFKAAKRFDAGRGFRFSTFACSVVWRDLLNFLADEKKHHQGRVALPPDVLDHRGVERDPDGNHLARAVDAALSRLDKRDALVIRRRLEGAKLREIGEELNLSKERCRQLEHRAKASLAKDIDLAEAAEGLTPWDTF